MAWKPAMKSDSGRGGALVRDCGGIKNPMSGFAIDPADMGRSVLRPYKIAPSTSIFDRADEVEDSQFELHAVVGDFEAGIDDGAMFGSALVEDRVGVVDVNQDAAAS